MLAHIAENARATAVQAASLELSKGLADTSGRLAPSDSEYVVHEYHVPVMVARSDKLLKFSAMQPADVPVVAQMEQRNYEFPWSEKIFSDCVVSGYQCVLLLEGTSVIGYGILQVGAGEAHILNLCIDAPYQRQGYARRLLDNLTDIARGKNAQMLFLEVRPSNPRAVELYSLSGFNEIGTRRGYYDAKGGREDALVMARSLAS